MRALTGAILAAALLWATPAGAQIKRVVVRVDGLSCPFCAYSLEKGIKRVKGTGGPVINVEKGVVTLTPITGQRVRFDDLRAAVSKAGFTPREVRVEGVGRIESVGDRYALVSEDDRRLFFLAPNEVLSGVLSAAGRIIEFNGTLVDRKAGEDSAVRTLALVAAAAREGTDAK